MKSDNFVECYFCGKFVLKLSCMPIPQQEFLFPMLGDNQYICNNCEYIEEQKGGD